MIIRGGSREGHGDGKQIKLDDINTNAAAAVNINHSPIGERGVE